MVTYYFKNPEEALKRAKAAGKKPGCWYGGITLRSGKKGRAIYKNKVGGRHTERVGCSFCGHLFIYVQVGLELLRVIRIFRPINQNL